MLNPENVTSKPTHTTDQLGRHTRHRRIREHFPDDDLLGKLSFVPRVLWSSSVAAAGIAPTQH